MAGIRLPELPLVFPASNHLWDKTDGTCNDYRCPVSSEKAVTLPEDTRLSRDKNETIHYAKRPRRSRIRGRGGGQRMSSRHATGALPFRHGTAESKFSKGAVDEVRQKGKATETGQTTSALQTTSCADDLTDQSASEARSQRRRCLLFLLDALSVWGANCVHGACPKTRFVARRVALLISVGALRGLLAAYYHFRKSTPATSPPPFNDINEAGRRDE